MHISTTKELKKVFTEFFESKKHKTLPSSSVIPYNDPSLLFVNSGMVQFKGIFLGEKPEYKRVNTVQHCIRAGGKHNDLDDVGKDNYHHTFFEMMGNWSFGDYFKEEAIQYAFEFLVDICKLDKERLYVTVYDELDSESRRIWQKYLPNSKIIESGMKDNFWEMGEFGPCGPCTEIHYDRIGGRDASDLVNKDDPNVLEVWNIVFMEFNRTPKGLIPLEIKKIDTGIGLERLLSILIDVKSNYLIDTFQSIIKVAEDKSAKKYVDIENSKETVAFRVLADHSRTIAICVYYGVSFSNEGIGYVLRRILRRMVRYGDEVLNLDKNALIELILKAADSLELGEIDTSIVKLEIESFEKTLKKGLDKLHKMAEADGKISSENLFLLYDSYGFPKDLTEIIAAEEGIEIDDSRFDELLEAQKERSKVNKEIPITINFPFEKTVDKYKYTEKELVVTLQAIVVDNEVVERINAGEYAYLIFNETCFYARRGGQIGDSGKIEFIEDNKTVGHFKVEDTIVVRGFVCHYGVFDSGRITKNAKLTYDICRRSAIAKNHSSCHILGGLIKQTIDGECEQQGSFVDEFKCTYDFNFKGKFTEKLLEELENNCNAFVESNAIVTSIYLSKEEVDKDNDIILMKNVKYPDPMRVIVMKNENITLKELCGGTHVSNTSEIRKIRFIGENGVSTGIRRITICTGTAADACDENAKIAREMIKNGVVASLDVQLSILEKRRIEELNKVLIKKITKEAKNKMVEKQKEIEREIEEKLKKISFDHVEFKEIQNISSDKKNQMKMVAIVVDLYEKKGVNACVYTKTNDNMLLVGITLKDKKVLETLENKYKGLRRIREVLQGQLNEDEFNSLTLIKF